MRRPAPVRARHLRVTTVVSLLAVHGYGWAGAGDSVTTAAGAVWAAVEENWPLLLPGLTLAVVPPCLAATAARSLPPRPPAAFGCLMAGLPALVAVVFFLVPPAWFMPDGAAGQQPAPYRARPGVHEPAVRTVTGVLVLLGASLSWRRLRTAPGARANKELRSAIDRLDAEQLDARLDAIATLERIARDSVADPLAVRDRLAIAEALTTLVRQHGTRPASRRGRDDAARSPDRQPALRIRAPDAQAALTVLGCGHFTDLAATGRVSLNLQAADLREADLAGGDLRGANLATARLEGARLAGVRLDGANLAGAHLEDADLSDARLDGAHLSGAWLERANLAGAHLNHADLRSARLEWANLFEARLGRAGLVQAHLEQANLAGASLERADLGAARLEGANLAGARLSGADLFGAHLEWAYLAGAQLEDADFRGARLDGANLTGADLGRAELALAHLEGADLGGADLEGAHLFEAHLEGANLAGAHLAGAELLAARLERADLGRADLERADLRGTRLDGADLTGARLSGAKASEATRWPEGYDWQAAGVVMVEPSDAPVDEPPAGDGR